MQTPINTWRTVCGRSTAYIIPAKSKLYLISAICYTNLVELTVAGPNVDPTKDIFYPLNSNKMIFGLVETRLQNVYAKKNIFSSEKVLL